MKAIRLRCEYLKNPIGIDIKKPRVSWNCVDGIKQEAYEIEAYDENNNKLFSTGVVNSDQMHLVTLDIDVSDRERIYWRVRLLEDNKWGPWSEFAYFEMGISQWKAKWITGNYVANKKDKYPVDYFKKTININKSVRKARIYATACGIYETFINDKKCGDFCLAPGYTDYNKRIQYQTIDVTDMLQTNGEYNLIIKLANGWYRGSVGAHGLRCQFGTTTKVLYQLEITYDDGSVEYVLSNDTWTWSNDGPIMYADNKDGEVVDANKIPTYSSKAKLTSHKVIPTCSNNVALKEHEHFIGEISKSPSGKTIVDFKQNLAGKIKIKFSAHKNQVVRIRFGELLGEDGELIQSNIQCISKKKITPLQEVLYTCKEGINEYSNEFSIFGFKYIELNSGDIKFDDRDYFKNYYKANNEPISFLDLEAESIAVYSDIEEIGFFDSSNALLNQFVYATKWSTKSNSGDIPTDCPTRERHGWTGDAQIFFKTASYLFDYAAFSKKYLNDVYDWQKDSGRLPMIAPYAGVDSYMWVMNGSVGWSDIGILNPYNFYKMNGDKDILNQYYDRMKKYAHFMQNRCGKWGGPYAKPIRIKNYQKYLVNCGQSYDEWAEPQDVKMFHWTDFAAPHPEVSTAYTAYIMHLMIEIAKVTGHFEDIDNYKEYEEGCTLAYQELIKQKGFELDTDRQARLVRPLAFNLLNDNDSKYAKERLLKAIENYKYRLGTGFLSTPLILDVLSNIDLNVAYKLLENEEIPGWLSMPKAGATTIWEAWEGSNAQGEVASLNHYSKGALCEWLFRGMCGINMDGKNHFIIKPLPGGHFDYASASYNSVYGFVKSGWKKVNNHYTYSIVIPANTRATVVLPDGIKELGPGSYDL